MRKLNDFYASFVFLQLLQPVDEASDESQRFVEIFVSHAGAAVYQNHHVQFLGQTSFGDDEATFTTNLFAMDPLEFGGTIASITAGGGVGVTNSAVPTRLSSRADVDDDSFGTKGSFPSVVAKADGSVLLGIYATMSVAAIDAGARVYATFATRTLVTRVTNANGFLPSVDAFGVHSAVVVGARIRNFLLTNVTKFPVARNVVPTLVGSHLLEAIFVPTKVVGTIFRPVTADSLTVVQPFEGSVFLSGADVPPVAPRRENGDFAEYSEGDVGFDGIPFDVLANETVDVVVSRRRQRSALRLALLERLIEGFLVFGEPEAIVARSRDVMQRT